MIQNLPDDCLRIILYFCESKTILQLKYTNKYFYDLINDLDHNDLNIFYLKCYLDIRFFIEQIFNIQYKYYEYNSSRQSVNNNLADFLQIVMKEYLNSENCLEICNFENDGNGINVQKEKVKNLILEKCKDNLQKENLKNFFNFLQNFNPLFQTSWQEDNLYFIYKHIKLEESKIKQLQNLEFTKFKRFKFNISFQNSSLNFENSKILKLSFSDKNSAKRKEFNCSQDNKENSLYSFLFKKEFTKRSITNDERINFIKNNLKIENLFLIIKYYLLHIIPYLPLFYLPNYCKVNNEYFLNETNLQSDTISDKTTFTIPKEMTSGSYDFLLENTTTFRIVFYFLAWDILPLQNKIRMLNILMENYEPLNEISDAEEYAFNEVYKIKFKKSIELINNERIEVTFFTKNNARCACKKIFIPLNWNLKDDLMEYDYALNLEIIKQLYQNYMNRNKRL
ncbi:hypothetical protein ABK040_000354 [Willaertia magna]